MSKSTASDEIHPDHLRGQIQALDAKLETPDLPFAESEKINAQKAHLQAQLDHHGRQQKGREKRESDERKIARKMAWEAAFAKLSDPEELLALTAAACEKLLELKPLIDAIESKYTQDRSLVTAIMGAAPDSTNQIYLMRDALWYYAANSGVPVRGFDSHPDFYKPEAVARLISSQSAGDLRVFGQKQGYLLPNFQPNRDWKPAA